MGIEDLKTIGKVVSKADEAAAIAKVAEHTVFEYKGVKYAFPKGTRKEDALRFLWQSGIGPGKKGEQITLPSELPKERIEELETPIQTAEIIPFVKPEPKKLDPGIYVDEDTGKYFRIDKEGNMEPLDDETP